MSKRCTLCLEWKEPSEFYRDRGKGDGLKSYCKACHAAYKREWRLRRRLRERAQLSRTYRKVWIRSRPRPHVPVLSADAIRWLGKIKERRRAYLAAYLRRWHRQHPDASRTWYANSPELATTNRQSRRAEAIHSAMNTLSPEEWAWLTEVYQHRCAYCGQPSAHLTPDHIIPLSQGGHNALSNIIPACSACNSRKGARTPAESNMALAIQVDVVGSLQQLALL